MGLADIRSVRQQAIEEPFGDQARATLLRPWRAGSRPTPSAKSPGQGVAADKISAACARAYPLRRHRHAADRRCRQRRPATQGRGEARVACKNESRPSSARTRRGSASSIAARIAGDRGGVGRGRRRRRDVQGKAAQDDADEAAGAGAAHALLLRRQMAPRARLYPRDARARAQGQGPRHHHRAASDRRGRTRLAGRADRQKPSGAAARAKARRARAPSAPMPIR